MSGEKVVKAGLAKALERKMGQDEGILTKIETKGVDSSLLMNPSRRRIFEFICNNPCSHLRKISRSLDFSTQTARWHLLKLVDKNLIAQHEFGRKKLYSPLSYNLDIESAHVLALLNNEDIKKIYLCIKDKPNITQKQLGRSLDIYQQLLSRSLLIMEGKGLITHKKQAREKVYFTTDLLKQLEYGFDKRSLSFEKELINALKNDGVDPKLVPSDKNYVKISIDAGGKSHSILKINKNPVRAVLEH
jgi:predicted transcriptional regulator